MPPRQARGQPLHPISPPERRKIVLELQKRVLEQVYNMLGLWWTRRVVHLANVKNYVAPPSHYTNQNSGTSGYRRTEREDRDGIGGFAIP
jgi:hypothetical protein